MDYSLKTSSSRVGGARSDIALTSSSFTPTAGARLLVAGNFYNDGYGDIWTGMSVSDSQGLTWETVIDAVKPDAWNYLKGIHWKISSPVAATPTTVTIDTSGSDAEWNGHLAVYEITGSDGTVDGEIFAHSDSGSPPSATNGGYTRTLTEEAVAGDLVVFSRYLESNTSGPDVGGLSMTGAAWDVDVDIETTDALQGTCPVFAIAFSSELASDEVVIADTCVNDSGATNYHAIDTAFIIKTASDPEVYTLNADAGTVTVSGQNATLLHGRRLNAESGSVVIAGQNAGLRRSLRLNAEADTVTVSGQNATLLRGRRLNAESGAISVGGADAAFVRGYLLKADGGTVEIVGGDANLNILSGYVLNAEGGVIETSGQPAGLRYGRRLNADGGSVETSGTNANLLLNRRLSADAGAVTIGGYDVDMRRGRSLQAESGSLMISGADAAFVRGYVLKAGGGTVTINGGDADLYIGAKARLTAPFKLTLSNGRQGLAVSDGRSSLRVG